MSHNILHIIGYKLNQGGHINSLLNLIEYISHNNKNILVSKGGSKSKNFRNLACETYSVTPLFSDFTGFFLKILWILFIKKINIIHAHDYKSLKVAILLNFFFNKKIVFTKAGGVPIKTKLPKLSGFIVYSKELFDYYSKSNYQTTNAVLIQERIKIEEPSNLNTKQTSKNSFTIFIAMRFSKEKYNMFVNLFKELNKINHNIKITLIIAGGGLFKEKIENLFVGLKSNIIPKFLGEIKKIELINKNIIEADLIVGHGRGIIEAIAFKKVIFLLSFNKTGSTLVNSENIEIISKYNFSGRGFDFTESKNISLSYYINNNICFENKDFTTYNLKYIKLNYCSKIGSKKLMKLYNSVQRISRFSNFSWLYKKYD